MGGAHHASRAGADDYGFEMTSHDLTFVFHLKGSMREAFWPLNTPFCADCLEIITKRAHYNISLRLSYPVILQISWSILDHPMHILTMHETFNADFSGNEGRGLTANGWTG